MALPAEGLFENADLVPDQQLSEGEPVQVATIPPPNEGIEEPTEEQEQQPSKKTDWEKRYKDLQSFSDRRRIEMEQLIKNKDSQLSEIQKYEPIINFLKKDEKALNILDQRMRGVQSVPEKELILPPRPRDFDPTDVNDPSTSSGQWYQESQRIQQEQFKKELLTPVQKEVQDLKKWIEEREQEREKKEREQAQVHEFDKMKQNFMQSHPEMDDPLFEEMMYWVKNPGQITLDDFHSLWLRKKEQIPTHSPLSSQVKEIRTRETINAATIPAAENVPLDQDTLFSQDLLKSSSHKRWEIKEKKV